MCVSVCPSTRSGAREAGDATRWCRSSGSVPPLKTVIRSVTLKAPESSLLLITRAAPRCALPGVPGLPQDRAFLQGQHPGRCRCRRRWGAIVGPQNRSRKDKCGGGRAAYPGLRISGAQVTTLDRAQGGGYYHSRLFSLARPFPPLGSTPPNLLPLLCPGLVWLKGPVESVDGMSPAFLERQPLCCLEEPLFTPTARGGG